MVEASPEEDVAASDTASVDEVSFLMANAVEEVLEEGSEDVAEGRLLLLHHLNRCMYVCLSVAGGHEAVLFIC